MPTLSCRLTGNLCTVLLVVSLSWITGLHWPNFRKQQVQGVEFVVWVGEMLPLTVTTWLAGGPFTVHPGLHRQAKRGNNYLKVRSLTHWPKNPRWNSSLNQLISSQSSGTMGFFCCCCLFGFSFQSPINLNYSNSVMYAMGGGEEKRKVFRSLV